MHEVGLVFAGAAALVGAEQVDRGVARGGVEPGRQHRVTGKRAGFAGEFGEHLLRNIGRAVRVAARAAQGRGIDEVEVPSHEGREGRLGFFLGVAAE